MAPAASPALPVSPNRPRILVVEDHERLRAYLKENLSEEFTVFEAMNGADALEKMKHTRPDLIITDWIMPVMDGREFLRHLKSDRHTASIPLILLTARDGPDEQQEGLDLGADQVITKPFNLQILIKQAGRTIKNNHGRMRDYATVNPEHIVDARENRDGRFMEEVERIICDHIRNSQLNAAFLARELALSRTALFNKIKTMSGMTPGDLIQKIRLKRAVKLMLYEKRTVSEVCVMVGISSSSYLIRLFKKYYKTTPREYIKNLEDSATV